VNYVGPKTTEKRGREEESDSKKLFDKSEISLGEAVSFFKKDVRSKKKLGRVQPIAIQKGENGMN